MLSKKDIINGKESYEQITLKSVEDTVCIRPLSIGEIHQVQKIKDEGLGKFQANQKQLTKKKNLNLDAMIDMPISEMNYAENKANTQIIVYGLDNPGNPDKWTHDDVNQMSPDLYNELLYEIQKISHMDNDNIEMDVESFHEEE